MLLFLVLLVSTPLTNNAEVFDQSSCGSTFENVELLQMSGDVVCDVATTDDNGIATPAVTLIGATTFDLMGHELTITNQREVVFATGVGTVIRNGILTGAGVDGSVRGTSVLFWSASDGFAEDLTLASSAKGITVSQSISIPGREMARNTLFRRLMISDTLETALDVQGENCTFTDIETSGSVRNSITVTGNQHKFQDVIVDKSVLVEGNDVEMRNFEITGPSFSGPLLEVTEDAENGFYDGFEITDPATAKNNRLIRLMGTNQTVVNANLRSNGGCVDIGGSLLFLDGVVMSNPTASTLSFLDSTVNCPQDVTCITAKETLSSSTISGNTIEGCGTSIEVIEGASGNTIERNQAEGDLVDANDGCGSNTWQGGVQCATAMPTASPAPTASSAPTSLNAEPSPEDDGGDSACLFDFDLTFGPFTFMFCLARDLWDILWGIIQAIVGLFFG